MCLNLVPDSEKMRKQGHQGVAIKPLNVGFTSDNTQKEYIFFSKSAKIWSMLRNKNKIFGDFKKNGDIKTRSCDHKIGCNQYLKINVKKSNKTISKLSLNSHVYWDTLYKDKVI